MDSQFKKRVKARQQADAASTSMASWDPFRHSSNSPFHQQRRPSITSSLRHGASSSSSSSSSSAAASSHDLTGAIRHGSNARSTTRNRGPPGTPTRDSGARGNGRRGSAAGMLSTTAAGKQPASFSNTANHDNILGNTDNQWANGSSSSSSANNILANGEGSNQSWHQQGSSTPAQNTTTTTTITNIPSTPSRKILNYPLQSDIPGFPGSSSSSSIMRSPPLKSPSKKKIYDRYIPVREGMLSEHYDLLPETPSTPSRHRIQSISHPSGTPVDPTKKAQYLTHDTVIANELNLPTAHTPFDNAVQGTPRRLFAYSTTTTRNTFHFDSPSRQIYSATPMSIESRKLLLSPKKTPRAISKVPFKILDAPDLQDDFYLNLVDWSSRNELGVGLGNSVYLWSALTSNVTQLCNLGNDIVTSINWISPGTHLAVGTNRGLVQIWDVEAAKRVRSMKGHSSRVGVLAWSDHILTSGSRDRNILHRDVRAPGQWQHRLIGHNGEVCGLKWNASGTQLASGGNDNRLLVWEKQSTSPLYTFRDHTAAVKAIDWSPHTAGLLASGGGTQDRHIRFWNTTIGTAVHATDTGSQVCNLAWSRTSSELVSTHGFSQNQVLIWKYPSMETVATLTGHNTRVLYLALSPDGQTIVTGAGDETLRFWNVFQKSKSERREDDGLSMPTATIR
ncbi:substrate-specific activator of APC-dependent proteolysis [Actinomortierella ambigua]|uniref:Substrate-specific activator of APC-dependent proteolysis n=1 Tax=Actinomortierella ambigua TaxID=1343610 RepID=A0A9P6QL35_9FUNG|nr:substrate-specific activator of APC-dependent proteolysis [Actinomortierella ambigua]